MNSLTSFDESSLIILTAATCALYLVNGILAYRALRAPVKRQQRGWSGVLGFLACLTHAAYLSLSLFEGDRVSLGLMPMLSVTLFAMSFVIVLNHLRQSMHHLGQIVFPIAALVVLLQWSLPDSASLRVNVPPALSLHIVLSMLAYSVLALAALQAIYLTFFDQKLKLKQPTQSVIPPIQTLDTLLFESIWIGLIALSLSILTGLLFMESMAVRGLLHHTILTAMAWVIFVILLWGRYQLGWRGSLAGGWTLAGFILLALGYFGSKFVVEILLV
ncbi:MAG: cytochrome C assembly family protein [Pseudomonadales bacterium]